ncbi:hypothetical protein EPYR_03780 [Erwinia pyrifoliae DSM 12163]|nr:hypothetical protein EPYR_03780 [Erwinia pyrifoliae DSM 12163]
MTVFAATERENLARIGTKKVHLLPPCPVRFFLSAPVAADK